MRYVKCCFLIDATSSMNPYIQSAKRQARNIMTTLKQENPETEFLFGAVFYRDFGDAQPFIVIPFQEDISSQFLFIHGEGGNDIPEDVAGGYQKVLDMNWNLADVKFCFHITDAPPHGILWHTPDITDFYPHPVGRTLEDLIQELHRRDVHLSIIRINDTTDRMIENFRLVYGDTLNVMTLDLDANEIELDTFMTTNITRHISSTLSLHD